MVETWPSTVTFSVISPTDMGMSTRACWPTFSSMPDWMNFLKPETEASSE